MKLLTKELENQFEKTGRQEEVADPIVIAKFFDPCGGATWLATEYERESQTFFGYVSLFNTAHENELGYFSKPELESIKGPLGLGIERDRYFTGGRLSEVKQRERIA